MLTRHLHNFPQLKPHKIGMNSERTTRVHHLRLFVWNDFKIVLKSFWRHKFVVTLTSNDLNLVYCREVRWCSTTEVWALIIAKGILRHPQNYSCHILNKRPQTRRPTLNARTSIQSSVNNKYDIDDETFLIFYNRDVVLRILVFVYNEERRLLEQKIWQIYNSTKY